MRSFGRRAGMGGERSDWAVEGGGRLRELIVHMYVKQVGGWMEVSIFYFYEVEV